MIIEIILLIKKIFKLPVFITLHIVDKILWIKNKGWKIFEGWGLHIYTGVFGAGKTSSMVRDAYRLAKKYKCLTILSNFKLVGFPEHTKILKLNNPADILNAPKNTLVLIDEIGTIFNSRDFTKSKESVPKILFQHLCQCRKRKLMMYATSQRWNFVDKQLRDIVATVRHSRCSFSHPFTRMCTIRVYDSHEYDRAYTNPMLPLNPLRALCYIQFNKWRKLYDTSELVSDMLDKKYLSDSEILENQGYNIALGEISKDGKKAYKKGTRNI